MALSMTDLKSSMARHRVQAECIGVAALAVVVFVVLGTVARRRTVPLRADLAKITAVSEELTSFQSAFKTSAPERDAAGAAMPDSFAIAIPRDARVSLAEHIASRAELVGLSDVRVKFTLPDSVVAPIKPELFGATVTVADYAISVDGTGGFAAVLSLVNQLPPSVAVQRLTTVRGSGPGGAGAHFHLILAIFESAGSGQHG